jgi:hypothetical protein
MEVTSGGRRTQMKEYLTSLSRVFSGQPDKWGHAGKEIFYHGKNIKVKAPLDPPPALASKHVSDLRREVILDKSGPVPETWKLAGLNADDLWFSLAAARLGTLHSISGTSDGRTSFPSLMPLERAFPNPMSISDPFELVA